MPVTSHDAVAYLSLSEAASLLDKKECTSLELTEALLARAGEEKYAGLNAYTEVTADIARERAKESDARRAAGEQKGALDGIPVGIKDLFCTAGARSRSCSKILDGFTPSYESTVTSLLREAGTVMLGKLNMDELAMGSANIHSAEGRVLNPAGLALKDPKECVPGGSSGGSAAAVAAGLCFASTGSDTGGSIRQPAAFCGVTGVKPTYGRCSRYGMIAFASSLDQAGVFTRNVDDACLALSAICGHDAKDATSSPRASEPFGDYATVPLKGLRIGIPKEYRHESAPAETLALWEKGAQWLQARGAELKEVSLPHTEYGLPAYYIIAPAEAAANLARYDGVRYGHRAEGPFDSLDDMYARTRAEGFGREVKRRIMIGNYVLSSGYYDAYYLKAQKVRRLIANDFNRVFQDVDVLLTPATPGEAFGFGEKSDPMMMYLNDVFTVPASLAGLPGMSVPAGRYASGLPAGLQIIAPAFGEKTMFAAAKALEEEAGFVLDRY